MNLPILPNWVAYLMALIALLLCILYTINQMNNKKERLDKDKAKRDIEDWAKTVADVDIRLRELYFKMNQLYKVIDQWKIRPSI